MYHACIPQGCIPGVCMHQHFDYEILYELIHVNYFVIVYIIITLILASVAILLSKT